MKLLLFDVYGTLAKSTQKMENEMLKRLIQLRKDYDLCLVGGGNV